MTFILERDGKILIGKRSPNKDFGAGIWEIPSGRVNADEELEQAIIREAYEELSVNIIASTIIHSYIFQRNKVNVILLVYYCSFEGELRISHEHSILKWIDPKDSLKYLNYDLQKLSVKKYLEHRPQQNRK